MNLRKLWLTLALLCVGVLMAAPLVAASAESTKTERTRAFVDPALSNDLKARGAADLFVYVRGRADLSPAFQMGWEERGHFVHRTLTGFAARTQAPIILELQKMGVEHRSFWIENVISIKQGNMLTVEILAERDDVLAIIPEPVGYIPTPDPSLQSEPGIQAPATNITQIKAPDVWAMGVTGAGVTVGIIDSGTRYTHQALVNQYRGNLGGGNFDHNYSWFDVAGSTAPTWPNPHGTHVTGTAIGDDGSGNQIGVAPGAKWVSCLGCTSSSCPGANLLACAQFMAAPTDLAGNNANPDLRPQVVNNSWGDCDTTYDNWYQSVVDAWVAAGVVPVFSNGNASNCGYSAPPGLNTVGNPARYGAVLGIGSSGNNNGEYATHSNWGPTDNPNPGTDPSLPDPRGHFDLKPNVIAPGVAIYSSVATSDTAYQSAGWNGTSMSSPAATGTIALMLSASPALMGDYATIGTLLMDTATPIPYASGGPNPGPGNVPNYATGWGEINALAAVQAAIQAGGPQGTISGVVTDSLGMPIAGARIQIDNPNPPPAGWSALTDAAGAYSINLGVGTYDVSVSLYGYVGQTETDVEIEEDSTTTVDFQLDSAGNYLLSGVVTDALTGWPLHARLEFAGYPGDAIYTDPVSGAYSIILAGGIEYTASVQAVAGGYVPHTQVIAPLSAPETVDVGLEVDQAACSAPGYNAGNLWERNFEVDDGGFVSSGSNSNWAWGTPTVWPNGCASGTSCWATGLSATYPSNADGILTSPPIDLTGATAPLTLTWQQANHVESFQWDKGYAEYSIDGGATWALMWNNPSATEVQNWREMTHDISSAAGNTLLLRWRITSDGSVQHPGLYVDDIAIRSGSNCTPMAGELVTGRVLDGNSGEGMNGAVVEVAGESFAVVTSTSADPALGQGSYTLFVPEGDQELIASAAGFQSANFTGTFADGDTRGVEFELHAGRVRAVPEELSKTQVFGTAGDSALILVNDGQVPATVSLHTIAGVQEDFEGDFPPAGWEVVNNGGACTWTRNDAVSRPNHAGGDGFSAAADSDVCGSGSTMDASLISPSFTVDATSELSFVLSYRHLGSSRLDVQISTDGGSTWTVLQSYTATVDGTGPGAPVTIPLAGYAGTQAKVAFNYVSPGWNWWAQVDQIRITSPADWLTLSPENGVFVNDGGVIPANSTQATTFGVIANFNAAAPSITQPGVYSAMIKVVTDTPYGDLVVPVQMVVTPSASQTQLAGQVTSLGYCDVAPAPAAGATLAITGQSGNYSVETDVDGSFSLWLDVAEGPVDVAVTYAGHVPGAATGVALIGGGTTPLDFELRLDAPCASVDPESLSSTLLPGGTANHVITLGNSGAADLEWSTHSAVPLRAPARGKVAGGGAVAGVVSDLGLDLLSVVNGQPPRISGIAPMGVFDCDGAPNLVIQDDGSIENGYSGNPAVVSEVIFVQAVELMEPGLLGTVCVSFVSLGTPSLNYQLVVYAADGAGGLPGTELASVSAQATGLATGLPASPQWFSVDMSSVGLALDAGTVYIGVRYAPVDPGVFIAADQTTSTPRAVSYWWNDNANEWITIQTSWPEYRALLVRPQILPPGGCAMPESVPWLNVSPASGTTEAGGESDIQVAINSAGLLPGSYEASVCISSNDPQRSMIAVPVNLTVEAPEDFTRLSGVVLGMGHCDAAPGPIAGAQLQFESAEGMFTTLTAADGFYEVMLDPAYSPVDITVSAAGHEPQTLTGFTFGTAEDLSQNFDLLARLGCTTIDAPPLTVELEHDETQTLTMTLDNTGLAYSTFSIDQIETTLMVEATMPPRSGVQQGQLLGADGGQRVTMAEISLPSQQSRTVRVATRGTAMSVAVISPDTSVADLVDVLNAFPDLDAEYYSGDLTTITAADLADYDVVMISNNQTWLDAGADVSVGNALADFVDAGGGVVIGHFAHDNVGWELGGRLMTGGYSPLMSATADLNGGSSLGTIDLPDHPIMEGVSTATTSYLRQATPLRSGADRIASWADGQVLVAALDQVVAFNLLFSAGNGTDPMGWGGDVDALLHNAILFAGGGGAQPAEWLSITPESGTVGAGDSATVDVTFTGLTTLDPGVYTADVRVAIDDGEGETVTTVPATMFLGTSVDIFKDGFEDPDTP